MAPLIMSLIGPFRVTCDGDPVSDFAYTKVRALLAYLVVEQDRPHRRESLAELLWPDQARHTAHHSLSQALLTMRQAINDRDTTPPLLLINRETVQFNAASDHWLDLRAFSTLLDACQQHPHRRPEVCPSCAQRLGTAMELCCGDFLEDMVIGDSAAFEDWVGLKRESLRERAFGACSALALYHEQHAEYGQACHYARRQLMLDSWSEAAHRQLMRGLYLSGQRRAALAQYARCQRVLDDELGVEPAAETTALRDQIRSGALLDQHAGVPVSRSRRPTMSLDLASRVIG